MRRETDRERLARDVREELEFHREMRRDEIGDASSTASPDQLTKLALARDRRLRVWGLLDDLRCDVLDSLRRLRRAPAFTLGTLAMLTLGLGANTAVFTVANTVYFRALPFADADRLLRIYDSGRNADGSVRWVGASLLTFRSARDTGLFAAVAALESSSAALQMEGGPAMHVGAGAVTAGWGEAIGVQPVVGRHFTPPEAAASAPIALISHHLWQARFAGRADIVGQTLAMDGGARTIVGVMPPGFRYPYEEDVWWPRNEGPTARSFVVYARLADGVTLERVNQELTALGPRLNQIDPTAMRGLTPRGRLIREVIIESDDRVVLMLGWAVAVLLLIVGSNAAMLLTTRLVARRQELAVRAALGCSRLRQMRMLIVETTMIFVAGGVLGVALTMASRQFLVTLLPQRMVLQLPMADLPVDWRVSAFTVLLALVAGVTFGAIAAWKTSAPDISGVAGATSKAIGSTSGRRTLSALVAIEFTLAAALLGAAVALTGGMRQLETRDVGFATDHLVTAQFELAGSLQRPQERLRVLNALEERLASLPGVSSVGSSTVNPLCCGNWGARAAVEGQPTRLEDAAIVHWRLVSPSFFKTLGIRVLAGRVFDVNDREGTEPVIVIDERMARRFWPGQDAIGHRVKRGAADSPLPWLRIVGVVSAVEDEGDYTETWYLPYLQNPGNFSSSELHIWARAHDVDAVQPLMRQAIGQVDRNLAIINLRPMDAVKRAALDQERSGTGIATLFGAAGVILALAGVYGLVTFVVAGERREMGIRMALGATPRGVMAMVLGRLARLALVGVALGAAIAWMVQPKLADAIGATPQSHSREMVLLLSGLLIASLMAAWWPARRVLKLNPKDALT